MRWEVDCEWQVKICKKVVLLLQHSPGKHEELARKLAMVYNQAEIWREYRLSTGLQHYCYNSLHGGKVGRKPREYR